jgi:hypothetical protein
MLDREKVTSLGAHARWNCKAKPMLRSPLHPRAENINHPAHYGGDTTYEAIKVIEAWNLGFCLGNTLKYIRRVGSKPGVNFLGDLRKARWYLDREISKRSSNK